MSKIDQFISDFKKTWAYDLLSQTLDDNAIFEHGFNGDGSIAWFKEQTRQMWDFWNSSVNGKLCEITKQ